MTRTCRISPASCAWLLPALLAAAGAAAAAPADVADHLIVSEVVQLSTTDPRRPACSEFIEIHNPTGSAIDLSDVYLTDGTFTTNNVGYWRIAEPGADGTTAGGGTFSDFHARFPDGAVIAAGDTIVISIEGSDKYETAYSRLPDFELYEDGDAPDGVPEMVEAFPGAINAGDLAGGTNLPTLTDTSESVVLYRWNGATNLVADLDYMRWGTTTSVIVDKTGVTIGGEAYQPDTAAGSQQVAPLTSTQGQSMMRVSADEGTETLSGGNGATGHDETSENLATTWTTTTQDPALAPASHLATAPIVGAVTQEPAEPVAGQTALITLPVAAEGSVTGVEIRYTIDGGAETVLAAAETAAGSGVWTATLPGQAEGADVAWYAVATGSNGRTSTYPAAAPRYTQAWTVEAVPPPAIATASNSPNEPYDGQEATLSVTVTSISPITAVTFKVSYDGGAFGDVAGADQGDDTWTAALAGQAEGTMVAWYVAVDNEAGLTATWPADAPATTEGWTVAEAPDPNAFPAKLLLTEICTQWSALEFIEIANPNDHDVDLSDYYLTDAIYSTGNQVYWRIAEGNPDQTTIGGGAFADFHARFPDGYTIAAGDTIVVSVAGSSSFYGETGFLPDLELFEDDAFSDPVPDMRWVFGDETDNSIIWRTGANPSSPTLSNAAETVVLYNWKQGEDKVTDIDCFFWKDATSTTTSMLFSKTGVTIGSHSYLPDTATTLQTPYPAQAPGGQSYQRVDAGEGAQLTEGSNGVFGRDETSEDFVNTFEIADADPSRPGEAEAGSGEIVLEVDPKTFLPSLGETFPIRVSTKAQTETRVRLYDREGRLVKTVYDSRFDGPLAPGGLTTLSWDGLDDTYQPVRGGMYIVHLSVVNNQTGDEETATAPVVVATRLNK